MIKLDVKNESNKALQSTCFELHEKFEFKAKGKDFKNSKVIKGVRGGKEVPKKSSEVLEFVLPVPAEARRSFKGKLITVSHYVHSPLHSDSLRLLSLSLGENHSPSLSLSPAAHRPHKWYTTLHTTQHAHSVTHGMPSTHPHTSHRFVPCVTMTSSTCLTGVAIDYH